MSHEYKIKMNYFDDWCKFARQELVNNGFIINTSIPDDEIGIYYFNTAKRIIPMNPRKVIQSSEFTIPPTPKNNPDYEEGIYEIKRKAEQGVNLNPHLSKNLKKIEYNDALLNDWGIHHLHLGTDKDREFYTERTEHVLFAVVTNDCFFMINIYDHNSWVEKDALDTIYSNWPHLLEPYRLKKTKATERNLSNEELKILRKKNANVIIKLDNDFIIMPPGGGYMTSGLSADVMNNKNRTYHQMRQFEKWTEENIAFLVNGITNRGGIISLEMEFHIQYEQNCLHIYEEKNSDKIKWKINPNYTVSVV